MKRIVAILTLAIGTAVAAHAAQTPAWPRQRVSAPHDHTPTIHSRAAQPHK